MHPKLCNEYKLAASVHLWVRIFLLEGSSMQNVDLLYLSQEDIMSLHLGWDTIIGAVERALIEEYGSLEAWWASLS